MKKKKTMKNMFLKHILVGFLNFDLLVSVCEFLRADKSDTFSFFYKITLINIFVVFRICGQIVNSKSIGGVSLGVE